jgi:hypothetical protein
MGRPRLGIAPSLGLLFGAPRLRFIWDGQRSHHFWITNAGFCPLLIKVEIKTFGLAHVFQRRSGTPLRMERNPLKLRTKFLHWWGPDWHRSGPYLCSRFHRYIKMLDRISYGVLLGC